MFFIELKKFDTNDNDNKNLWAAFKTIDYTYNTNEKILEE